jgi:hypothetical protein
LTNDVLQVAIYEGSNVLLDRADLATYVTLDQILGSEFLDPDTQKRPGARPRADDHQGLITCSTERRVEFLKHRNGADEGADPTPGDS